MRAPEWLLRLWYRRLVARIDPWTMDALRQQNVSVVDFVLHNRKELEADNA